MHGLELREAKGKGKGVFATKDFHKGELILENDITKLPSYTMAEMDELIKEGKIKEEDTEHCDYVGNGRDVIDFSIGSYINHSCDPNAYVEFEELGKQKYYAICDIKKGEEITYDYSIQAVDCIEGLTKWKMECHCGSKNCRGIVAGNFFDLPIDLQKEKIHYVPTYIKKRFKQRLKNLQT